MSFLPDWSSDSTLKLNLNIMNATQGYPERKRKKRLKINFKKQKNHITHSIFWCMCTFEYIANIAPRTMRFT